MARKRALRGRWDGWCSIPVAPRVIDVLPNPLIIPVGLAIGILVSAPVGPVNVLCMQRALEKGFWGGVAAGAGAVLGDALIALSAAMGVGAITGVIKYYRFGIQLVGGMALIFFGWRLYRAPGQAVVTSQHESGRRLRDYMIDLAKSFFLTITNPGAVLGLFAIFGGVGSFVELDGPIDALTMVAAVAAGSLSWWIFLSAVIRWVDRRYEILQLSRINLIAGILLIAFGLVLIGELVWAAVRAL